MLRVEDLNVSYGYLQVLWDISFEIRRGEIVTLIGSNGAGKTTLVSAVLGFLPAKAGTVSFNGARIEGLPAYEVVRHHLTLTKPFEPQELIDVVNEYLDLL